MLLAAVRILHARLHVTAISCACHTAFLEYIFNSHEWPDGFPDEVSWLTGILNFLRALIMDHARDAVRLGLTPVEHLRARLAIPG